MGSREHKPCRRTSAPRLPDARAAELARGQLGLLTRAQGLELGLTPEMIKVRIERGRWRRVHRGVYAIAGTKRSWRQSLLAACLFGGPESLASHRSAGRLWRFPDMAADAVELIAPRGRRVPEGATLHHVGLLEPVDRDEIDGIPVTSAARTLFDLASVADARAVGEAIDDALRRRLVTMPRLRWELSRHASRGRPGVRSFRRLLEQRAPRAPVQESVLETRMLRLLGDAGFDRVVPQYPVHVDGRLVAVVDFAFPDARVAVEVDGYRWHSGLDRWQRDLERRTLLGAHGWLVLHFTARDLRDRPAHVTQTVARALRERA